ncbi:unnamed protein product [Danaus chrysippus]|uniref:(African queen) hypothetical protein n=1 Tax=Danaus chrysippus TaxID=151541 RepID=A0A8J2R0Z1_9NEOP|nr:unnamed protein product [Danaus chrysippus]
MNSFCLCNHLQIQCVNSQCWGGYSSSFNPYSYNYGYGQPYYPQMGYQFGYQPEEYYQTYYKGEEPTVIVINGERGDDGFEWMDILSFISSLRDNSGGPVYIPYPVPMGNSDCGCSDCGSRSNGCDRCNKCQNCNDCNCNCCKKQESSCGCNSGNCQSCGCNKSIKHKNNCCCRS